MEISLSEGQREILDCLRESSVFLEGPPGSGKTTVAAEYAWQLAQADVPAQNILVLLPQRTLAEPYNRVIHSTDFPAGGLPQVITLGGLARRMVNLYWPVVAKEAGFAHSDLPPRFLTHDTSQFYAALVMRPFLEKGFFDTVTLAPARLYSQLLDTLNKAAITGFPYTAAAGRLKAAWSGRPEQLRVYDEVQICVNAFRAYCLGNNLLDYSLQMEIFLAQLWKMADFRTYFYTQYRYLIYDNIEEDPPAVHDLVEEWLPNLQNALLVNDTGGGYRLFLGADPQSAVRCKPLCANRQTLGDSYVKSAPVEHLRENFRLVLQGEKAHPQAEQIQTALKVESRKYYPEMVAWVADEVQRLISRQNVEPGQICIISPFLSDALRFEISIRFEALGIPFATHRPSRSIREEAAAGCLLTLCKLLHPEWRMPISTFEFRSMLMQAITGFDLIRADMLTEIIYRPAVSGKPMAAFNDLPLSTQERITFVIGERYDLLRNFIEHYRGEEKPPLDVLLSLLFSELLSKPGFGFHADLDAAAAIAHLIAAYTGFTRVYNAAQDEQSAQSGPEAVFIDMIQQGILPAQYLDAEQDSENAVFLSPAYSFLMANRPVQYQFWLDVGSLDWWRRLNQPLTQPYVLSRGWDPERKWTDADEIAAGNTAMQRLVSGLLHRCGRLVTACIVEIDEQGNEQRGPLLRGIQNLFRAAAQTAGSPSQSQDTLK